jgi:hypothetical protein
MGILCVKPRLQQNFCPNTLYIISAHVEQHLQIGGHHPDGFSSSPSIGKPFQLSKWIRLSARSRATTFLCVIQRA